MIAYHFGRFRGGAIIVIDCVKIKSMRQVKR